MGSAPLVLIVEDDRKIAALVAKHLEAAGFQCAQIHEGGTVLDAVGTLQPALLVLDLMLPVVDGLDLARRIRARSDVPMLMLTARSTEADKLLGFEVGADDYLTKPFSPRELIARVRALLRRTLGHDAKKVLQRGPLRIDAAKREVFRRDEPVTLTTLEFDVLFIMALHPGRVFGREALMNQVWGQDRVVDERSIDSLMSRLRRKLEKDPARPEFIQTVWGAGYRFAEPVEG